MKKRNIFLMSVIVLIIIFLVFLYMFRLKFSKETNLLCTFKGYNTTLKTNIDTSVLSTFKGNKLDKINKIKEIVSKYYQYTQFKRAQFECKEVKIDTSTKRVVEMNFQVKTKNGQVQFD